MSTPAHHDGIGSRTSRVEDARFLTGQGRYIADVSVPGMVHACFVRSTWAHAVITQIDTSEARQQKGVLRVLTATDLPHNPLTSAVSVPGLHKTPQPALANDRVKYVGEPIAIVLATSRALAEDAAELVQIDVDELPIFTDPEDSVRATDSCLIDGVESNVVYHGHRVDGDTVSAFSTAAHVVTGRFRSNRFLACPMETRGCVAVPEVAARRLTFYSSTQSPHLLRSKLAYCLDMGESHIRVVVPDVGGAFGLKIPASPEEVAVALAARHTGKAVSWIEDRNEHLIAAPHAKDQIIDASLALSEEGDFLAIKANILGDSGAYSFNSASALVEPYLAAGLMPGPYRMGAVECEITAVLTNKSPIAPYRGVGWTAGHSAREMLIELAARKLGRDPVELRRQNLVPSDEFPFTSVTGMTYDSGSFRESLDHAVRLIGYADRANVRAEGARRGKLVGFGVTPYVEPTGWGSRGALESQWSFASHDVARVTMDPSGEVTVAVGTPSSGQGIETMSAQMVSQELGIPIENVSVVSDDTASTPISVAGTRASRGAVVTGGLVGKATQTMAQKLRLIAAHLIECDPTDIELSDGEARVVGSPDTAISIPDLARAAHFSLDLRTSVPEPDLTVAEFYDPPATYSNGCIAAVVEIDTSTLGIAVVRGAAVEDCGTMVNPLIVEGQVLGAFCQGVGAALFEHMTYDEGQPTAVSFMDYLLPTATEMPRLSLGHEASPSPVTQYGIKGVGESGLIATPAAILSAIADALASWGIVPDRSPVTSDYVLEEINRAKGA